MYFGRIHNHNIDQLKFKPKPAGISFSLETAESCSIVHSSYKLVRLLIAQGAHAAGAAKFASLKIHNISNRGHCFGHELQETLRENFCIFHSRSIL